METNEVVDMTERKNWIGNSGFIDTRLNATDDAPLCSVPIMILDYRKQFGREDFLVTPNGGAGQNWISSTKVRLAS